MPRRRPPKKGFLTVGQIFGEAKQKAGRQGIEISEPAFKSSLKRMVDRQEVPGAEREEFGRRARIVPQAEARMIIDLHLRVASGQLVPLIELGKSLGFRNPKAITYKEMYSRHGLKPVKVGSRLFISREEYEMAIRERASRKRDLASTIGATEIAKEWGCHPKSVKAWIKAGKIPYVMVGNKYRVSRQAFGQHGEEWLREIGYSKKRSTASRKGASKRKRRPKAKAAKRKAASPAGQIAKREKRPPKAKSWSADYRATAQLIAEREREIQIVSDEIDRKERELQIKLNEMGTQEGPAAKALRAKYNDETRELRKRLLRLEREKDHHRFKDL